VTFEMGFAFYWSQR